MASKDLKKWRAENGYSQSQLAIVLGVAPMTVSRWETGLREIPSFLHLALECLKAKGGELKSSKGMTEKTKKKRR
jgi:transcriptional regulator with XRE-family HTH domain